MTCSYMNESRNYENNQIIITFNGKAGYDAKLVCFKYSQNKWHFEEIHVLWN
jgi:hypothetical protein